MLYERLSDQRVHCHLCAHECEIAEGRRGICQVRENQDGTLYTLVYGRTVAKHVDPVEKKPLLHFYPGSRAYSIATPGCNFRCWWCQNAEISQARPAKLMPGERSLLMGQKASPEEIVAAAKQVGCRSLAYTYTEPTVFFEYSYDTAQLAHEDSIANIYVTNGFMTEKMLQTMDPYLDAANVDLKGFRDETYRKYVGARLQPVLDSLRKMKELGIWVEVTTLVIPEINDESEELRDAARFIAEELGPETPWHISRFRPAYKMTDKSTTSPSTLKRAQRIGLEEGLHYVYVGNVPGESNTVCHQCGETLIRRSRYRLVRNNITEGSICPNCSTPVAGVGMEGS
jgi:pyruvate formate lyase activating enzyme